MAGYPSTGVFAALAAAAMLWPQAQVITDHAEREVTTVEAARSEAKQHGDTHRLEELLAPDFIKINRFGRLLGKRQTIALARNPNYTTVDVQLRIYDSGAVVTGRESDEGEPPESVRFMRVWIRDGQKWRELADEGTRITSEPEAARIAKATPSTVDRTVAESASDTNHVAEAAEAPVEVAQEVRSAERRYRDAERLDDVTTLSRFRAPEFRLVDRLGNVLSSAASPAPAIKAVQDEDFNVRVHRNIAIVIGSVLRDNLTNGATDRFRYSAVWVRRDGQWRVVAEQQTPIG
jgi:Domain of unknown function (DUF4440)